MKNIIIANKYSVGTLDQILSGRVPRGSSTFSLEEAREFMSHPSHLPILGKEYSPDVLGVYRVPYQASSPSNQTIMKRWFYPDNYGKGFYSQQIGKNHGTIADDLFLSGSEFKAHPLLVQVGHNKYFSRGSVIRDILKKDVGEIDFGRIRVVPYEKIEREGFSVRDLFAAAQKIANKASPLDWKLEDAGEFLAIALEVLESGSGLTRPNYEIYLSALARLGMDN